MSVKNLLTAASILLALSAPAAVLAHADHGKPQYGGVVVEAGEAQFEIVSRDGNVVVHASHHGTPLTMAGASGKLSVLDGARKTEIPLQAAGENRVTGAGVIPGGAKLLLNLQMPGGKTLQARGVAR